MPDLKEKKPVVIQKYTIKRLLPVITIVILSAVVTLYYAQHTRDGSDNQNKKIPKASSEAESSKSSGTIEEGEKSSVSFASHQSLSPKPGEGTVLSFYFQLLVPPSYDRRQRLIMHYEANKPPYAGWALALRRLPSSYRFEYYLQNREGTGGWFSFDATDLVLGNWYALSIVIEPSTFLSSYLVEIVQHPDQELNNSADANKDVKRRNWKFKHLGGFPVEGLHVEQVDASLQISSGAPKIGPFKGKIEEVTILRLPQLPAPVDFVKDAYNGPRSLLKKYPDACVLSQSRFAKNCEISGGIEYSLESKREGDS